MSQAQEVFDDLKNQYADYSVLNDVHLFSESKFHNYLQCRCCSFNNPTGGLFHCYVYSFDDGSHLQVTQNGGSLNYEIT